MGAHALRRFFGSRVLRGSAAFLAGVFAAILIGALAVGGAVPAADPADVGDDQGQRYARPEALKGESAGDGSAENPYVVPVLGFWVRGLLAAALVAPGALAILRTRRESDFLTNRGARGRTDTQLRRDFESLRLRLIPIIRDRKTLTPCEFAERLHALAPWATAEKLEEAASAGPVGAAHILLGSRHRLERNALRKRIVRAKKRA